MTTTEGAAIRPLIGHVSMATALLVDDYPYGNQRCRIRYWLEHRPKFGYRLVSQTEHPRTKRWNKPRTSGYSMFGAMYLDAKGHVVWDGVDRNSGGARVESFLRVFPYVADDPSLLVEVKQARAYDRKFASGEAKWKVNGVVREPTAAEFATYQAQVDAWDRVIALIEARKAGTIGEVAITG
ncbi:MAG: hypothetical protein ACHREM_00905 [Polyangiales bacterium]